MNDVIVRISRETSLSAVHKIMSRYSRPTMVSEVAGCS